MKIVVALDSFKGSLTSIEAGKSVKDGIIKAIPDALVNVFPLADGGEGTIEALYHTIGGEIVKKTVIGPLFTPIESEYLILKNNTAVIEISKAAGLTLVDEKLRNPLNTTTYGVGELILDAIDNGCRNFIIGIGGSATNDGGIGMLSALGFSFKDTEENSITPNCAGLEKLSTISAENISKNLSECHFSIACDVTNPLCGKNGCSAVFAPQKGAPDNHIELMDSYLKKYAVLTCKLFPDADMDYPGSGAAGGLGFAFRSYLNADLKSGISIIICETGIEEHIKDCDLVVTGEGRIDFQTVMGKAPHGIAQLAKKYNKKVIAFSGIVGKDAEKSNEHGIDAFFPILRNITSSEEALRKETTQNNLTSTVYQVFRLINLF